jgi:hypothetical protein
MTDGQYFYLVGVLVFGVAATIEHCWRKWRGRR